MSELVGYKRVDSTIMSLREHYAGLALQGLLANRSFCLFSVDGAELQAGISAENAVALADALLAELAKPQVKEPSHD